VLNAERIDEIRVIIRIIREEQEEANEYLLAYISREKELCEEIQGRIRRYSRSFEASYGDQRWTTLVEEKYSILQAIECEHSAGLEELEVEQRKMNAECKSIIEDLEQEIQRLEMLGGELIGNN